jgi:hypothetical protein
VICLITTKILEKDAPKRPDQQPLIFKFHPCPSFLKAIVYSYLGQREPSTQASFHIKKQSPTMKASLSVNKPNEPKDAMSHELLQILVSSARSWNL